jgi:hypothetical protein
MQWQERLIFTRTLRGKTFWGYVKYIFSVTRYAVVEVPTVYQMCTILSWLHCNLLALLCITTRKRTCKNKKSVDHEIVSMRGKYLNSVIILLLFECFATKPSCSLGYSYHWSTIMDSYIVSCFVCYPIKRKIANYRNRNMKF